MSRNRRLYTPIIVLLYSICFLGVASYADAQSSALLDAERRSHELRDLRLIYHAVPYAREALNLGELEYSLNHPKLVPLLDNLANLIRLSAKYEEAEVLFRRALEIRERTFGRDHPEVAIGLDNLGKLLTMHDRYDEAEAYYERAMALRKSALGADHLLVAKSLQNVGWLYYERGNCSLLYDYLVEPYRKKRIKERCDKATPFLKEAIAMIERTHGVEHPEVATSIRELANMHAMQGDFEASETLHRRSLAIIEKAVGPNHPDVADGLEYLATLFSMQGRDKEAVRLRERASIIKQRGIGSESD